MLHRAYVAEFLGTFFLAFGVSLSVAHEFPLTPLIAAMTLGLFVYTVGHISGAHLNPAVTFGMWSVKKIKSRDALIYIGCQLLAGLAALLITWLLTGSAVRVGMDLTWEAALGELIGAFILSFGVSSVVWNNVKQEASGLVVGGSLLLGILFAMHLSDGVLNPAVDLALAVLSPMYIIGAVVGGILGAQCYQWLSMK
jgi:glycerol uptake facilitator-like aquaporin